MGKVVTFYSYAGGVGRTMALANVAWRLAASGLRVDATFAALGPTSAPWNPLDPFETGG